MQIFGEEYDATGIVFTSLESISFEHRIYYLNSLTDKLNSKIQHQEMKDYSIYSTNPSDIKDTNTVVETSIPSTPFFDPLTKSVCWNDPQKDFLESLNTNKVGHIPLYLSETEKFTRMDLYIVLNSATEQEVFNIIRETMINSEQQSPFLRLYTCKCLGQDYIPITISDNITLQQSDPIAVEFNDRQILQPQQFEKYMELSNQSVIDLMISSDQVLRESAKRYHQRKKTG